MTVIDFREVTHIQTRYMHGRAFMQACTHTHMHAHICTHMHTYTRIYTATHIYPLNRYTTPTYCIQLTKNNKDPRNMFNILCVVERVFNMQNVTHKPYLRFMCKML